MTNTHTPSHRSPPFDAPTLVTLAFFLVLTIVVGLLSDGAYHDDDLTHFLMARWARWFPHYLLHIWGRPGFTLPLAAVAWIGDAATAWHICRIFSALVTAATALLAARLAVGLGLRNTWLVVLACYLQPLYSLLACTTLTETFTAFYLTAAVLLCLQGRLVSASGLFSMALVTRHEAAILLPVWWAALLASRTVCSRGTSQRSRNQTGACGLGRRASTGAALRTRGLGWRKVIAILTSLWAPAVHNVLFRLVFDRWPVGIFLQPHGSTDYPPAGILSYLPHALFAISPVIASLAVIGGVGLLRRGVVLVAAMPCLFFLAHLAIRASGVFASGGYGRFMVTVAPLIAILAVEGLTDLRARLRAGPSAGWQWSVLAAVWGLGWLAFEIERRSGRLPIRDIRVVWLLGGLAVAVSLLILATYLATRRDGGRRLRQLVAVVLGACCVAQWAYAVRPLRLNTQARLARTVARWLHDQRLDSEPLFATNPWFAYFLDLVEHPRAHKNARLLASMPVGTIFIWDSVYGDSDFHRLRLDAFQQDDHYGLLASFGANGELTAMGRPPGETTTTSAARIDPRLSPPPTPALPPSGMHVFRKIEATILPADAERCYPPDLMSPKEPFLGVYYIRAGRHQNSHSQ